MRKIQVPIYIAQRHGIKVSKVLFVLPRCGIVSEKLTLL